MILLLALPAAAEPIAPGAVEVMDGDTVRAHGVVYRLIGLDAPETKSRAKCEAERTLGNQAEQRLRELVDAGAVDLDSGPLLVPGRHRGNAVVQSWPQLRRPHCPRDERCRDHDQRRARAVPNLRQDALSEARGMVPMTKVSLAQQIEEVDYELAYRAKVYPRIASKEPARKSELEYHEARMRAARASLQWLLDNERTIKQQLAP